MCDTEGSIVKAFGACKSKGLHPSHSGPRSTCTSAARVTVVVGPQGDILDYEPEFNARTGPGALLEKLTNLNAAR